MIQGLSQDENDTSLDNTLPTTNVSYVEKINNFSLQEFDDKQQVSHLIKAKYYLNFKDKPAVLLSPEVITYDNKGDENYTLASQRGNYFENGDIRFSGKVDIRSGNGITHKLQTQTLLVDAKTKSLISRKKVTYLGKGVKIIAQGMHMKPQEDKMKLLGNTRIMQGNGQKILTKDLYIDESNKKKHYYSKNKATYLSTSNTIYAQAVHVDMRDKLVQLLGKVKILQDSGSKINTKNLIVNQAPGNETYHTKNKIHYQAKTTNVYAKGGMRYDVKNQKIKLIGGVVARYE